MSYADTVTAQNPACACGHAMLRHVFGSGWCTAGTCPCLHYRGAEPKPHPVDTLVTRDDDGRAAVSYVPR